MRKIHFAILISYLSAYPLVALAQSHATPTISERKMHGESAGMHEELEADVYDLDSPPLPT
ncbi:MAG: hypothetical protein KDD60_07225, partial [Bdellovibrionales bacterium]|nr:hypothetical protein [Bdellovibrionales bacterium]